MFSKAKRFNYTKPEEPSPLCRRHSLHEATLKMNTPFKRDALSKSMNVPSQKKHNSLLAYRRKSSSSFIPGPSNSVNRSYVSLKTNRKTSTSSHQSETESSVSNFSGAKIRTGMYVKFQQPSPLVQNNSLSKLGSLKRCDENEEKNRAAGAVRRLNYESSSGDEGFQSSRTPTPRLTPEQEEVFQELNILGPAVKDFIEMFNKQANPEQYRQLVKFFAELKTDVEKKSSNTNSVKKFFRRVFQFIMFRQN